MPPLIAPTPAALGHAVRELRKRRAMSQEQLAGASRLHPTYLSGIEKGRRNPTWRVLAQLSEALEVRLSELVRLAEKHDGGQ